MSTNELLSKVRELKELQTMAEELQAEINSIQDAIKA
jgi:predicted transcriptional regulator